MPSYLDIDPALFCGSNDFYRNHGAAEDCQIYRAANLHHAAQLAANHYIRNFDRFHRSCRLLGIDVNESEAVVRFEVCHHNSMGAETHSTINQISVTYYGPGDMYTAQAGLRAASPAVQQMVAAMERELAAGNPKLRRSRRSGMVMFAEGVLPRVAPDGTWLGNGTHLAYADEHAARLQMQLADIQWEE